MKKKKKNNNSKVILCVFAWLFSAVLFTYIGYCMAGAIPAPTDVVEVPTYGNRILMVMLDPLGYPMNDYSPVGMISGFILSELLASFILIVNRLIVTNKEKIRIEDESIMDELSDNSLIEVEILQSNNVNEPEPVEEEEVLFGEKEFLVLMNMGFNHDQINEMMVLSSYIKGFDIQLLSRMFKTTMTPAEIRRRIELFYG